MVATAIVQNGGIFIPDGVKILGINYGQVMVNITIIRPSEEQSDPFVSAAGILRGKILDPMQFEQEARNEWNRTDVD